MMTTFDHVQMKKDKIVTITARIEELQQSLNTTIAVIQAEQFRLMEELNKIKQSEKLKLNFIDASNPKKKLSK
jgi:hypothetical protein